MNTRPMHSTPYSSDPGSEHIRACLAPSESERRAAGQLRDGAQHTMIASADGKTIYYFTVGNSSEGSGYIVQAVSKLPDGRRLRWRYVGPGNAWTAYGVLASLIGAARLASEVGVEYTPTLVEVTL